jgi:hypothetical protein
LLQNDKFLEVFLSYINNKSKKILSLKGIKKKENFGRLKYAVKRRLAQGRAWRFRLFRFLTALEATWISFKEIKKSLFL